jgi:predicted DNA-binding transcriptional regulator AlpA
MENNKNMQLLFPLEPDQFLQMVRAVVKEELEKHANNQLSAGQKFPGLTYKPLYKIDEVCEIFDITPPTVYDWIKHGKLKPRKIRSRVFFLWNDIQDLLRAKNQ